MKLMKQLLLGGALLLSTVMTMGSAQAASVIVTVDGTKGQSLLVTLLPSSAVTFVAKLFGDTAFSALQSADVLGGYLRKSGNRLTVDLFTDEAGGTFRLTPAGVLKVLGNPTIDGTVTVAVVPEPETYALLALGIAGLVLRRRRQDPQAGLTAAA